MRTFGEEFIEAKRVQKGRFPVRKGRNSPVSSRGRRGGCTVARKRERVFFFEPFESEENKYYN